MATTVLWTGSSMWDTGRSQQRDRAWRLRGLLRVALSVNGSTNERLRARVAEEAGANWRANLRLSPDLNALAVS